MTKKDYELIAAALAASRPQGSDGQRAWERIARAIALALLSRSNFNHGLFLRACGIEDATHVS